MLPIFLLLSYWGVPTTGRTDWNEFWEFFKVDHARRIDEIVARGERRLIILSKSLVSNYMAYARKEWSVFEWLPEVFTLGEMKSVGDTIVFRAPHFSSTTYKKEVFYELGDRIRSFCEYQ